MGRICRIHLPSRFPTISSKALCHGCRESFEISNLKQCSSCKRVFYCSPKCQKLDWKYPRNHKAMCQEDLLSVAIDNLFRLPFSEKMELYAEGKQNLVSNSHFCTTVAKVSCPNLDGFIKNAYKNSSFFNNISLTKPKLKPRSILEIPWILLWTGRCTV